MKYAFVVLFLWRGLVGFYLYSHDANILDISCHIIIVLIYYIHIIKPWQKVTMYRNIG